ncbi:hypothetical protein ACFQ2M_21490 [Kitasatospora saccharophila]|uniref:hypothetical protein n=1 Tax=Kitasatospora saccharophila TaxID=407973 RepID=UPI003629B24C
MEHHGLPVPGGVLDPTTVPLAELGLDVPGVDRRFVHFCAAALGVEAVDDLGELRDTFDAAWPDYREVIRAGLLHVVRNRPLSVDRWYQLTYVRFPDQQDLTTYLAQVYAYLFDGFDAMPPAPASGRPQSRRSRATASRRTSSFLQKAKRTWARPASASS